jgi:hypothetical protein
MPALTAIDACCTTSRVTRFTRAAVDCFPTARGFGAVLATAFLEPTLARLTALRRAGAARFIAETFAFFLPDDLLLVAMSPPESMGGRSRKIHARCTRCVAVNPLRLYNESVNNP